MQNLISVMALRKKITTVTLSTVFQIVVSFLLPCDSAQVSSDKVLGRYSVSNEMQCLRLCWYRKLCKSYCLYQQQVADNCWLLIDDTGLDLSSKKVHNNSIHNACASRPCDVMEVCVPQQSKDKHSCLPLAIDCGQPPVLPGAIFSTTGTALGDVATMSCQPDFVLIPPERWPNVTCLITSSWSQVDSQCIQVEFHNSTIPLVVPFPWEVKEDWTACAIGVFRGNGELSVNLLPLLSNQSATDPNTFPNITIRVVLRDFEYQGVARSVSWGIKENGQYKAITKKGSMPLVAGDPFQLHLTFLNNTFQITINKVSTFICPLPAYVNTSLIRYFGLWNPTIQSLSYVNLISGATCHA